MVEMELVIKSGEEAHYETIDLVDGYDSSNEQSPNSEALRTVNTLGNVKLGKELLIKSKQGNIEAVKKLIATGAPFTTDWVGTSPLHWAVQYNHLDVAEVLLKAGIAKDTRNKVDRTPSHVAAQNGFAPLLMLLIAYGSDVNCKDMLKMTPLHWAAESGSLPCVQILVDYNCDIGVMNKFDKTARDIAKEKNLSEIVKVLDNASFMDPKVRLAHSNHLREVNKIPVVTKPAISNAKGIQSTLELIRDSNSPESIPDEKCDTADAIKCTLAPQFAFNGVKMKADPKILSSSGIGKTPGVTGPMGSSPASGKQEDLKPVHSLVITDNGKFVYDLTKTVLSPVSAPVKKTPKLIMVPKLLPSNCPQAPVTLAKPECFANNSDNEESKRIIKVKASHLINMTKEKKLFITRNGINKPVHVIPRDDKVCDSRKSQIKIMSRETKEVLTKTVKAKLAEAEKQLQELNKSAAVKQQEILIYRRQLAAISKMEN